MPDDTLARIQLVQLEVDRLHFEAQTCGDPERMTAIRQEMEVLLESMREIRREQLMEQIDRAAAAPLVATRPAMNEREEPMGSTPGDSGSSPQPPPETVDSSPDPGGALMIFIGQELEAAGFRVRAVHGTHLEVGPLPISGRELIVVAIGKALDA